MKKFIYIILVAVASNLVLSSCTEEKVEPLHTDAPKTSTPSDPA